MKGEAQSRDRRRLMEIAQQAAEAVKKAQEQQAKPATVGDLVVLPLEGDAPLEWAVLHRAGHRLLLVPADTAPVESEEDLVTNGTSGPLTLRCGWARWIPAAIVEELPITGALEAATVTRARAMAAALEASPRRGRGAGSPGYRDWIESVIVPACAHLETVGSKRSEKDLARASAQSLSRAPSWAPTRKRSWTLPFAAGLLMALGTGLVVRNLAPRQASEPVRGQSAILPGAGYAFLHPSEGRRGGRTEIDLSSATSAVLLVAVTRPEPLLRDVELELQRLDDGELTIWRGTSPLSLEGEIRVVVPVSLLPAGSYRLRRSEEGSSPEDFFFEVLRAP